MAHWLFNVILNFFCYNCQIFVTIVMRWSDKYIFTYQVTTNTPSLVPKSGTYLKCELRYGEFCVKIYKFSLPWQQCKSDRNFTKYIDKSADRRPPKPLFGARILVISPIQAEKIKRVYILLNAFCFLFSVAACSLQIPTIDVCHLIIKCYTCVWWFVCYPCTSGGWMGEGRGASWPRRRRKGGAVRERNHFLVVAVLQYWWCVSHSQTSQPQLIHTCKLSNLVSGHPLMLVRCCE